MDLDVVNQADWTVEGCDSKEGGLVDGGERLEGGLGDEFEVVDLEVGVGVLEEMMASGLEVSERVLFASGFQVASGEEGAAEAGGVGAVIGGEFEVSGGEGEAIWFAKGIGGENGDIEGEIAIEALNDLQLLIVFFSENCVIWLNEVEES